MDPARPFAPPLLAPCDATQQTPRYVKVQQQRGCAEVEAQPRWAAALLKVSRLASAAHSPVARVPLQRMSHPPAGY